MEKPAWEVGRDVTIVEDKEKTKQKYHVVVTENTVASKVAINVVSVCY